MILFSWIIFSVLVGVFAKSKGQSSVVYFLLSLILTPLIGFLIALLVKDKKYVDTKVKIEDTKVCPKCAETVRREAQVCRYCHHEFDNQPVQTLKRGTAVDKPVQTLSEMPVPKQEHLNKSLNENNHSPIVAVIAFVFIIGGISVAAWYHNSHVMTEQSNER